MWPILWFKIIWPFFYRCPCVTYSWYYIDCFRSSCVTILPEPHNIEPWVHSKLKDFRNGPLKFVPKPGEFFKDTVKNPVPVYKPASKPVTYSFDYTEDSAEKSYNKLWESYGTRKNYDEIWNSNDINTETVHPGPYSMPGP